MARLSGIDLNLLLVFDAVYRHGSATAAANELNLTQPAVSNALTRLRGALNDPLFVRGPRGFLPTPYADSVAGAISEILARLDQTFSQVPTFDPTRAARAFHLTMSDIGERIFLPTLVRSLQKEAPASTLISRQLPPRETREGLSGGELDCALGFLAEPGEGMFQRLLFRERYVLMARADHPRVREGMSLADVRRETFACISHGGSGHDGVLDVLRSREVGVTVLLELGQFSAAPRIVAETDLIIVVPSRLGASLNIATPVKLVTPPFALPELAIKLYWHERSHNEAGNRWLRELIGTLFANDGAAKHVPPGA